ncbi:MAG: hypothetical protein Crog3KO_17980 [Crocinitomicaceae bacterium]
MNGIKLTTNGDFKYIVSPSGKRANAHRLEVGKTYLHQNLRSLRKITEIDLSHVYYEQGYRLGCCSKKSFVNLCPSEATKEEISFLTEYKKPHDEAF